MKHLIKLHRHGPKNNNPEAHQTGVEALLDPEKIPEIKKYALNQLNRDELAGLAYNTDTTSIEIETTPIDRSKATGEIVYNTLINYYTGLDEIYWPALKITKNPRINELIGSAGINPKTGEAVNLGPRAMSNIWGEAKKHEDYKHLQGENKPLYAWCRQGFDNTQANNQSDPGISLREIACRIGTYVYNKFTQTEGNQNDRILTLALGHSGDIEPFLYLCLEMQAGRDGKDPEAMTKWFKETGGALEPLKGIEILKEKLGLELHYHKTPHNTYLSPIGLEIFQQQAQWFKEYGKSKEVLEQKLRL
nr:hypothetical protein [Candidatus Woesearchaeota archaeon]